MFHFHSFNSFFYLHSHFERVFSILQFTCLLDSIGLCWFNALCNSKIARYIYYRCSFDSFSIMQPHRLSKIARAMFMQLQVSPNSVVSQFFLFFFLIRSNFSVQVRLLSHTLVLKFITLTSSARLPSHYFYCINICNVF